MIARAAAVLMLALALAGCGSGDDAAGPLRVSVIGPKPVWIDPGSGELPLPVAVLVAATAEGLVRFDGAGEVRPGLAQRWAVSDDGLSAIFRIEQRRLARGGRVTARLVARRLNAARRAGSSNPLAPLLGAITAVRAITDEVVEIELATPRPNLLQLLAQADLAVTQGRWGGGPWSASPRADGSILLSWRADADDPAQPQVMRPVLLQGEPVDRAIARFKGSELDVVLGGDSAGFPLVTRASIAPEAIHFDPVDGLFGFSFAHMRGAFADRRFRLAVSLALDRDAIVRIARPSAWAAQLSLLSPSMADVPQPTTPEWASLSLDDRRALAMQGLALVRAEQPLPDRLGIWLPPGPGSDELFASVSSDLATIGLQADRVDRSAADMRLVDRVAAADTAAWVLRQFTCDRSAVCDPAADEALIAARVAPSLAERSFNLARADNLLTEAVPFIPLARPLRWSLVRPGIAGFRPNRRGVHPFDALAGPGKARP
jgi:oligopeptide transport system substrate-binding protein